MKKSLLSLLLCLSLCCSGCSATQVKDRLYLQSLELLLDPPEPAPQKQ